jgi:hypothetical protein
MSAIQTELDALKAINFDLDLTAFDSWVIGETVPTFEPDLPDEEDGEKADGPLVLRVEFDNDDERQLLFFELRDRGLKVKV